MVDSGKKTEDDYQTRVPPPRSAENASRNANRGVQGGTDDFYQSRSTAMHPGGTTRQGWNRAAANGGDDEDDYNRLRDSREIAEEDDDDDRRIHTVSAAGGFSERDEMKKRESAKKE